MNKPIKYVAELSGVDEVTLIGSADLDYWRSKLGKFGLEPLERDGRAELHVIAASAKFKGMPFREISFSIVVEPTPGWHKLPNAACLLGAYNSNRFFAWCERFFFSTPYYPANCEISTESINPVYFQAANSSGVLFSAELYQLANRTIFSHGSIESFGTVALLPESGDPRKPLKYFVARLNGEALVVAFEKSRDVIKIARDPSEPLMSQLLDSNFAGERWLIRSSACHAKSKTYK
jgi:hypothetical protein